MLAFRYAETDGVSVVARTWIEVLTALGFEVTTVAGEGADRTVAGLGIPDDGATAAPPDRDALAAALADADLVVVENLCTMPVNPAASAAAAEVLAGRPTVLHHHDPPWHSPRFAHVTDMPCDDPAWAHVSLTRHAANELLERRGIQSAVIHNGFHGPRHGDRAAQRAALGVAPDQILLAHPVRAIERKNIPAAIRLAEEMGAVYWLPGPAEEGYRATLETLLSDANCEVVRTPCHDIATIYAAADAVAYPSTWEGFGNPPIEAALYRRPVAVGHYPFAAELRELGFDFFDPTDSAGLARAARLPDTRSLDHNQRLATEHFSFEGVARAVEYLLERHGWLP
jgi:glycosyltransferase involved in cell wall biosynthesis